MPWGDSMSNIKARLASTLRESIWSWSRVVDFLSFRVKPTSDSKAPTKTTRVVSGGGFMSASKLLNFLLNLLINYVFSSLRFFLIALNSLMRYSWFLLSPHFWVKEFSSCSHVVMEELGRDLNHFLASTSRDCRNSLITTSNCSKFMFLEKSLKVSMWLCAMLSSSPFNLGECFR